MNPWSHWHHHTLQQSCSFFLHKIFFDDKCIPHFISFKLLKFYFCVVHEVADFEEMLVRKAFDMILGISMSVNREVWSNSVRKLFFHFGGIISTMAERLPACSYALLANSSGVHGHICILEGSNSVVYFTSQFIRCPQTYLFKSVVKEIFGIFRASKFYTLSILIRPFYLPLERHALSWFLHSNFFFLQQWNFVKIVVSEKFILLHVLRHPYRHDDTTRTFPSSIFPFSPKTKDINVFFIDDSSFFPHDPLLHLWSPQKNTSL